MFLEQCLPLRKQHLSFYILCTLYEERKLQEYERCGDKPTLGFRATRFPGDAN